MNRTFLFKPSGGIVRQIKRATKLAHCVMSNDLEQFLMDDLIDRSVFEQHGYTDKQLSLIQSIVDCDFHCVVLDPYHKRTEKNMRYMSYETVAAALSLTTEKISVLTDNQIVIKQNFSKYNLCSRTYFFNDVEDTRDLSTDGILVVDLVDKHNDECTQALARGLVREFSKTIIIVNCSKSNSTTTQWWVENNAMIAASILAKNTLNMKLFCPNQREPISSKIHAEIQKFKKIKKTNVPMEICFLFHVCDDLVEYPYKKTEEHVPATRPNDELIAKIFKL